MASPWAANGTDSSATMTKLEAAVESLQQWLDATAPPPPPLAGAAPGVDPVRLVRAHRELTASGCSRRS